MWVGIVAYTDQCHSPKRDEISVQNCEHWLITPLAAKTGNPSFDYNPGKAFCLPGFWLCPVSPLMTQEQTP